MNNEDGIYRRKPNEAVGATYDRGYYVGRYDVTVHAGRRSDRPQWWTVRLLPQRGPLADSGPSPLPPDVVSGDAWARIICGVQGEYGTLLASWPMAHIATVNVYSHSVAVLGMLSASEVTARLASRGPDLTAQILDGRDPSPTGLRWCITGGPEEGNDTWLVPIPPGARSVRVSNRVVSAFASTINLVQLDYSTPSTGFIVRQQDPPLSFSTEPRAVVHRICDSATHVAVDVAQMDPLLLPGVFDLSFDILSGMSYDAV